jgi:disulfide bond formation protein DsbB
LLVLLGFYSALALVSAYVAQYIFGHQPCVLCLYQRLPFFAVTAIALVFLLLPQFKKWQKSALIVCVLLLFGNAILAGYHVGVEQKIFAGPTTCSDNSHLDELQNVDELMTAIAKTKAVKCDTPSFVFLGLSMAAWNVIYCLFLAISTAVLLVKSRK